MSLPQRRQRTTATTPLEDAKDAILNTKNLNEDDRYQLLTDSLSELPEEECLTLIKPCISACWSDGLSSIIADISVEYLNLQYPLDATIDSPTLTERQMVRMMTPLVLKGCDVNDTSRPYCALEFAVVQDSQGLLTPLNMMSRVESELEIIISFAQKVVNLDLPSVLKLILPRLDQRSYRLALIEAFSSNRKACCEKLLECAKCADEKTESWPFAIALCCAFGRADFLEQLLKDAPEDPTLDLVRTAAVVDGSFCAVPPDLSENLTALESAIYFNHSECVKLLVQHGVAIEDENVLQSTMEYCAINDLSASAKEVLLHVDFGNINTLLEILNSYLKLGRDPEMIAVLVEKLKHIEEGQQHVERLLLQCAKNRWWRGLEILAVGGEELLRESEITRGDAEDTLLSLVVSSVESPLMTSVIRSLAVFAADNTNIEKAVVAAARSGRKELLKFFCSLNAFRAVARKLKLEARYEKIREIVETLGLPDVKIEVKEEAEEEEEEEEEESEENTSKSVKKKPTPKSTKAKQPKAKAAKASSAIPKPAAKKAGKTMTKKK